MPTSAGSQKAESKASRPTLILEADFILSADFQVFHNRVGWEGFGLLLALLGLARRSHGYKLEASARKLPGYALLLNVPEDLITRVIDAAVASTMLARDGDLIWSPKQLENLERFEAIRRIRSEAGKLGGRPRLPENQNKANESKRKQSEANISKRNSKSININIQEGGAGETIPEAPKPPNEHFSDPGTWHLDNRHICAGKIPLKKYPAIWLTETEFPDVLAHLERLGLHEPADKAAVFKLVESKIKSAAAPHTINAFAWLTGFAATEAIKQLNEAAKLERNLSINAERRL